MIKDIKIERKRDENIGCNVNNGNKMILAMLAIPSII